MQHDTNMNEQRKCIITNTSTHYHMNPSMIRSEKKRCETKCDVNKDIHSSDLNTVNLRICHEHYCNTYCMLGRETKDTCFKKCIVGNAVVPYFKTECGKK